MPVELPEAVDPGDEGKVPLTFNSTTPRARPGRPIYACTKRILESLIEKLHISPLPLTVPRINSEGYPSKYKIFFSRV